MTSDKELLGQLKQTAEDLEEQVTKLTEAIAELRVQQLLEVGEWL